MPDLAELDRLFAKPAKAKQQPTPDGIERNGRWYADEAAFRACREVWGEDKTPVAVMVVEPTFLRRNMRTTTVTRWRGPDAYFEIPAGTPCLSASLADVDDRTERQALARTLAVANRDADVPFALVELVGAFRCLASSDVERVAP